MEPDSSHTVCSPSRPSRPPHSLSSQFSFFFYLVISRFLSSRSLILSSIWSPLFPKFSNSFFISVWVLLFQNFCLVVFYSFNLFCKVPLLFIDFVPEVIELAFWVFLHLFFFSKLQSLILCHWSYSLLCPWVYFLETCYFASELPCYSGIYGTWWIISLPGHLRNWNLSVCF